MSSCFGSKSIREKRGAFWCFFHLFILSLSPHACLSQSFGISSPLFHFLALHQELIKNIISSGAKRVQSEWEEQAVREEREKGKSISWLGSSSASPPSPSDVRKWINNKQMTSEWKKHSWKWTDRQQAKVTEPKMEHISLSALSLQMLSPSLSLTGDYSASLDFDLLTHSAKG